jgi:hypothetical protein
MSLKIQSNFFRSKVREFKAMNGMLYVDTLLFKQLFFWVLKPFLKPISFDVTLKKPVVCMRITIGCLNPMTLYVTQEI